ncbi:hypothetical protein KC19_2G052100 [Ceratodon purpureus]|uniref:F-box domain-containing protein n=1 Tax=Ceratodon purpureus TaxID=3225 RepID=A0A8T0IQC8_CERPU|nr:hypothetical protein KC19_2G052100 [Ceratodon purpureus]
MMAFNGTLWNQLPLEVLEQILSFLPMPDLCRYYTTCKTWNELIKNPAFSVLHVRNRNKHSPFIAIHSISTSIRNGHRRYMDGSQVMCFLDISSKKWYSMKFHDALKTSFLFDHRHFRILAMDGGLMLLKALTRASKSCHHESGCTQLCVWNPIKDMKIKLPCVTNHKSDSLINFVVDDIAETFKVFVIRHEFGESLVVDIYDYVMKEWKTSSKLEMNNTREIFIIQSFVFQNLLYIHCYVMNHGVDEDYELWRYNHLADIWERLHFTEGIYVERDYTQYRWQFIVSGERLFVMCERQWPISHDVFEVHEIDIQSRATKVLLKWTKTHIMTIFGIDVKYYNYNLHIYGVGFNKSLILVSSLSRNVVIFDVETKKTNFEWPQLPLRKLRVEKESYSFIGKQMDFLLPGTLK